MLKKKILRRSQNYKVQPTQEIIKKQNEKVTAHQNVKGMLKVLAN